LLESAIRVLCRQRDLEYIVIGGWCPVLRNTSRYKHPGTLDVDILFRQAHRPGELDNVILEFIRSGYIPSAKHPFQLLKRQEINGKDLIYNVDLLHPAMTETMDYAGMFVDHLELDIPLDREEKKLKTMVSVVLPNSDVLFKHAMYDNHCIANLSFNLVDFTGMFLTKVDSCQKPKRERDSFDIFIAFSNDGVDVDKIRILGKEDKRIERSLSKFRRFLQKEGDEFDDRVSHFCDDIQGSPANKIQRTLFGSSELHGS
jgi:hypothetical protein